MPTFLKILKNLFLIIEKPKVNIDVDSVVVNNKPNDEDFFDDFFGSEDE